MSKISLKHSGGNVVSLNSPTSAPTSSDVAFKLPNADGTNGQVLKTDGSGNLSFGADSGGKILQVIQDTKTDTQSIQSQSFVDISGLSVTITPSATTSKIRIFYAISSCTQAYAMFRLQRNGTDIFLGDADGSRTQSTFTTASMNQYEVPLSGGVYLDSPSSTSALTYKFQVATPDSSSSQVFINRYKTDSNSNFVGRPTSVIIVEEVAA
tara:strand:+ start:205 stop:834 length:630 start_codon:yes stop_codon:yes gene_type:complete